MGISNFDFISSMLVHNRFFGHHLLFIALIHTLDFRDISIDKRSSYSGLGWYWNQPSGMKG